MSLTHGFKNLLATWFGPKTKATSNTDSAGHTVREVDISAHAKQVAAGIRNDLATSAIDEVRKPAIFLHAVMPRSGSVHVANLIRLHPELAEFPNDIWEIPFLSSTSSLLDFQKHFFETYSMNDGKIGQDDFLPIFGSAFIRYLHAFIPHDQRLFMKEPRVDYLEYFFAQFPNELLILLMRDGRDVVNSTVKSWPEYSFEQACVKWKEAAERIDRFPTFNSEHGDRCLSVKYEEIIENPVDFAKSVCRWAKLDPTAYPFQDIDKLPVQGSSAIKPEGQVDWEPRSRPKDFNPVGRWQSWDESQKNTFKRIAGDTLIATNYAVDSNW